MRSPSRNVVGRNTRTPLFSSCVTLDDGASSDDVENHVLNKLEGMIEH